MYSPSHLASGLPAAPNDPTDPKGHCMLSSASGMSPSAVTAALRSLQFDPDEPLSVEDAVAS